MNAFSTLGGEGKKWVFVITDVAEKPFLISVLFSDLRVYCLASIEGIPVRHAAYSLCTAPRVS